MKNILEYYLTNCNQSVSYQNELMFEFNNFSLIYIFQLKENFEEDSDENFYSYQDIYNFSDIDTLLSKISRFTSFLIKGYEYLGWREDLTEVRSITNEMYILIKKIKYFHDKPILNYNTDIEFGDPMCDVEGNYIFIIQISEHYWWDIKFANLLIGTKLYEVTVPTFYLNFFVKNQPFKDERKVPILSTGTKTRRLGYFKILSKFFEEYKKISVNIINKKFEFYCTNFKDLLEQNQFKKGLISETKSGISAKPYIVTANDLDFINKINNIYNSGKQFKVYQTLQYELSTGTNIFRLNNFDKLFFLESILRYDFFYFSNLLELFYLKEKISYSHLVHTFQKSLLSRLAKYKQSNLSDGDRRILNNIDTISNRIKKWEKAEVYLEHIIMPRLNWMLDFEIIEEKNNKYEITEIGSKLFQHLCIWNDLNTSEVISPDAFLDNYMIHLFDDCFNLNKLENLNDINYIIKKIYSYIEESFGIFKTLAPNRVTASQSVTYVKYKMYFSDKIKVDYQYILEILSDKNQNKFIFKYQEQYQDGYIQKK